MAYSGVVKPANKIVAGGKPLEQELKIETATNMYPGRLVKKGTNDDDMIVNTAAGATLGWLGYEQTNPVFMPTDVDTVYVQDDMAAVLYGGGFLIVGRLASGQNVTKSARLKAAANGELAAGIVGTDEIVAIAEESVDASSAAADIVVLSLI
ncbi:hypothetical protein J2755_001296 [Methanohalophilus levihalophilus]|uniref:gp53 minor capsid family protein n=1 Tax=Methanohalophilus levihalophilus TaxID=1431282 RepID=UPI001AE15FE4|nr:hypothetical protein [Methanohalophilus levihalophilus]MBP2030362.1 hypothetical protein [Methanohalophilus levihalophilus]